MIFGTNTFNKKMHKAQELMQKHALGIAENKGIALDYSADSIRLLDDLIKKISEEVKREGLTREEDITNHEGVKGICEALGSYISECAERLNGRGRWTDTDPDTNEPRMGLILPTNTIIFPMDWVMKKLIDPKGYSIYAIFIHYVS
jgi:hypothetical protein